MEENTAVLDTPEVVKHTGAVWYPAAMRPIKIMR